MNPDAPAKRGDLARKLALSGAALILGFLAIEGVVRALDLPIGARTESRSVYGARYVPDTPYGLDEEHPSRGRMNNVGFHDRPIDFDLPDSIPRIAFFGDSYTEARQVEVDSTFASVFEDSARARGCPLDAAAFGIIGSGADQSFFRSLRVLQEMRVDEVVYVFCANDFHDGYYEASKPRSQPFLRWNDEGQFWFAGEYQYDRSRPELSVVVKRILAESHLIGFVSLRLSFRKARRRNERPMNVASGDSVYALLRLGDEAPPPERAAMERWQGVVRHWKRACDAQGVRFRVLHLPTMGELDDSTSAALAARWDTPRHGIAEWMRAYCDREGIGLLDPTAYMIERTGGSARDLFWNHFSYAGHKMLASYLLTVWIPEWEARDRVPASGFSERDADGFTMGAAHVIVFNGSGAPAPTASILTLQNGITVVGFPDSEGEYVFQMGLRSPGVGLGLTLPTGLLLIRGNRTWAVLVWDTKMGGDDQISEIAGGTWDFAGPSPSAKLARPE